MALKNHPDYLFEKEKLEYIVDYVKTTIEDTANKSDFLRKDTKEAFVEYDSKDSSSSYDRITLNAQLFSMTEQKYNDLLKAQIKPYFCRIDVIQEDDTKKEQLYIGKMSLQNEDGSTPLIIDWRAAVASVYYDGRLGSVSYESPEGTQNCELILKRQYTINNAMLEDIMDVDITTTDAFLQAALGENKDNRLKDIVSTIQAEQNEIIRADIRYPLIVQGAAGSGKTTIALHRIAYLIYTFAKSISPDNFLIIAPNGLFLNYISEVLPELGVEHIKQLTYIELTYMLTGIKYKLADPDEKLIRFISGKTNKSGEMQLLKGISHFKGTLEFKDMVDRYITSFENSFIPMQDFILDGAIICTADEIRNMFLKDYSFIPIYERVVQIKKILSSKLKRHLPIMLKKIENKCDMELAYLRKTVSSSDERRGRLIKLMDQRDEKLASLKKTAKTAVSKYSSLLPKKDLMSFYKELITHPESYEKFYEGDLKPKFIKDMCQYNAEILNNKMIEFEDLTALLYIKNKMFGLDKQMEIRYIVIDEAQDFSLFQLFALKEIFKTEMFTILGDLAQGIHSYRGINSWEDVTEKVFTSGKCKYLTLQQSYRTTIEIMNAANEVLLMSKIQGLVLAKPVVRHGEKPVVFKCTSDESLIAKLRSRINERIDNGYKTVAVICKTADECAEVNNLLNMPNLKLLTSKVDTYEGGITLLPSYLAKGLEFDAVVICCLDEDYTISALDLKLLYVAMTRALHRLDIVCTDKTMSVFETIKSIRITE